MSIIKIKKKNRYSSIDNNVINDERLSWKARGILIYLLSKPDNWQVRMYDLIKGSKNDGETSVKNALKELRNLGYAKLVRGEIDGKFGSHYVISEEPGL